MLAEARSAYFTEARRWQSWLDVEAALARVQAEAGIIPEWAAREITAAARLETLDLDDLRAEIARTMAPVHALSRSLAAASGEAGAWVHWGATTQNVIDTGRLLVLKDLQSDLKVRLAGVLTQMCNLAEAHARTPMVGRTNRQHALPITFGFKVAGWIDETIRVCDQLEECETRLFQLRFGGAIGAFQSLGAAGPNLSARLAEDLGLRPALYEGRAQVDVLIEYVSRLGMLGVAAVRIASDLYEGMQTELGELSEDLGHDVVGSSTMPHKVNPKLVVTLKADANRLRSLAASAYCVSPPSHEGDAATNQELRSLVNDTALLALRVAQQLCETLTVIEVDHDGMAQNLASSGDLTALESVMMHLAPKLGRGTAHNLLHDAATRARTTGMSLERLVAEVSEVTGALDTAALRRLFDPVQNTGQSAEIALQLAAAGRARAEGLGAVTGVTLTAAATAGLAAQRS